jgi:hypothetical protein
LAGITKPKSRFWKARGELGIEVIPANSPQAKGRVERNHGVDQDRLVKEPRLAGIPTIAEANRFLREVCLPKDDAHVPLFGVDLADILCFGYERTVSNDYIVRFENRLFQILKENRNRPQPAKQVTVRKKLYGTISIHWNGKALKIKEVRLPESNAA